MTRRAVALVGAMLLAGCSSKHDVNYYEGHGDDRDAVVAKCQNDPGALQHDPDCVNAIQAKSNDLFTPGKKGHASIGTLPARDK